jgi:hypothetical protein
MESFNPQYDLATAYYEALSFAYGPNFDDSTDIYDRV